MRVPSQHPSLVAFVNLGILDFACVDVESPSQVSDRRITW